MNQKPNQTRRPSGRRSRFDRSSRNRHHKKPGQNISYIDKKYLAVFFDTFPAAKSARDDLLAQCESCDQLNVAIKAEGNMDDTELLGIHTKVKVYAGEAWTLIHERRRDDGWYETTHKEISPKPSDSDNP